MEQTGVEQAGPEMRAEALRSLFERRYLPMVRLAELLLGDRAAAEDAVQDAFARLHGRLDAPAEPEPYLRAMVVNRCRSAYRHKQVVARYVHRQRPEEPAVEDAAGRLADHDAVLAALRRLPRRQREVLVLRYYLDCPEAEIASALGISAGSVKTHAARGLAAMAALLGGDR